MDLELAKIAEKESAVYAPIIVSSSWYVEVFIYEGECNRVGAAKLGLAFKTKEDAIAAGDVIFNLPKPENQQECSL